MTLADVEQARAALVARGQQPSQRAVLAELGRGSKRDVAKYLRQLSETPLPDDAGGGGEPEPEAAPEPTPPPVPVPEVDPVALAEQWLAQAKQTFRNARAHLRDCRLEYLIVTLPLYYEEDGKKLLVGSFDPTDEIVQEVLLDLRSAKVDYDYALTRLRTARETLAQAVKVHRRGLQERWVSVHKHTLVEERDKWRQKYLLAPSDRMALEFRKNFGIANTAWEQAVQSAPWTTNGTTAEER
jgi:hypothetical protein